MSMGLIEFVPARNMRTSLVSAAGLGRTKCTKAVRAMRSSTHRMKAVRHHSREGERDLPTFASHIFVWAGDTVAFLGECT